MTAFTTIAAANVSAGKTKPKGNPFSALLQTAFTTLRAGLGIFLNFRKMLTTG